MSDARHELLSAIYAVLADDADLSAMVSGVFDGPPAGAAHPFVAFGEVRSRPLDADDAPSVEHTVEVMVHARSAGRREASDIAERVRALVEGASLAPVGHTVASVFHRDTSVRAERDGRAYRAVLRFRAVTDAI